MRMDGWDEMGWDGMEWKGNGWMDAWKGRKMER